MATLTGNRHRGRPRTKWCDSISDLALPRLGDVEPAELSEIAEKHKLFRVPPGTVVQKLKWVRKPNPVKLKTGNRGTIDTEVSTVFHSKPIFRLHFSCKS